MISRSAILAVFLYKNPDVQVYDHREKCFYYYSSEDCNFYYVKPFNKIRNKPYRARGLDSFLKQYLIWRGE